jgi:2,4-dichlorophenol 6-monooxygenase
MGVTLFATSLAGDEIARLSTWGTGDGRHGEYVQGSPCPLLDIPQPHLEPVLLKNSAERGATFAFNTEYLHHDQDDTGVTTHLRDRLSGREYTIRARYLVGADGPANRSSTNSACTSTATWPAPEESFSEVDIEFAAWALLVLDSL